MPASFKALRITQDGPVHSAPAVVNLSLDDLTPGNVVVKVDYASINYKDALALTGKGKILKKFPLVPGIDLTGHIVEISESSEFKVGDAVIVSGGDTGERYDGGYAEYCRTTSDRLIKIPETFSTKNAIALGTAGFTAGLCLERMLANGQKPEMGPIAITGASGGVGSISIALFAKKKFEVWAISSKKDIWPQLNALGATKCLNADELKLREQALQSVQFGGAIDNVGGELLSQIFSATQIWGNVACVGLADTAILKATVMPLILRGVSLLGISSNNCPRILRQKVWSQLFHTFSPAELDSFVSKSIPLSEAYSYANLMLQRKTHGRCLVRIT